MYEYKVITQRDQRLSGAFDPDQLETLLNLHAADGWRVVEAAVAVNLWKTAKAEFVMILERARPEVSHPPTAPS